MSILFVGKKGDPFCDRAIEWTRQRFSKVVIACGRRGDPFPADFKDWKGDYLISYLSPWIIPADLLARAKKAAINFHPGPPSYPGIGCTNFALYHCEAEFGITCHHMNPKVDTGKIIAVRRFPIAESDSVYSLTQKCYAAIYDVFLEIMEEIRSGKPLRESTESWTRRPYKRVELDALCELTLDMSEDEMRRRIRAVTFPGMPGAFIRLAGQKFVLEIQEDLQKKC
jgi:methionyl-tRNA formyltransferase